VPESPSLATLPAHEMLRAYAARELSPVEVHDAVQEVVEQREPVLNAFWRRDPEASGRAALESERRWATGEPAGTLDGVPVTLKENLARRGVPMPAGNAGVEPVVPDHDAPATARVLEAGAVVLGSTVMPDWGMLSSGVSSLHGTTRSPWHPAWTTGGSSSGAGAAAAGGYGPLHVGTDIGGSIRLPGTWLGLVALKPSAGRVPLDAPYLGRVAGPLTRTVDDAALLMRVISRPDARDWTSLPPAELDWDDLDAPVAGLRVALHLDAGCGAPVEPVVADAVRRAAATFADAGAVVEELPPFVDQQLLDALDEFWRVRSWTDYRRLREPAQRRVLPYIAEWCSAGSEVSGARVLDDYHLVAQMQSRTVAATLPHDLVLSPVAPTPAIPAEQPMPVPDPTATMSHIGFTAPYNMSGQPAVSINAGFTDDGRPLGVQVAGRRFDDLGVLRAAAWYERHRPASAVPAWPDGPPFPRGTP